MPRPDRLQSNRLIQAGLADTESGILSLPHDNLRTVQVDGPVLFHFRCRSGGFSLQLRPILIMQQTTASSFHVGIERLVYLAVFASAV
jgi:hypothetical protein